MHVDNFTDWQMLTVMMGWLMTDKPGGGGGGG